MTIVLSCSVFDYWDGAGKLQLQARGRELC